MNLTNQKRQQDNQKINKKLTDPENNPYPHKAQLTDDTKDLKTQLTNIHVTYDMSPNNIP